MCHGNGAVNALLSALTSARRLMWKRDSRIAAVTGREAAHKGEHSLTIAPSLSGGAPSQRIEETADCSARLFFFIL